MLTAAFIFFLLCRCLLQISGRFLILLLLLTFFHVPAIEAFELQPLVVRNLAPPVIGFGLPTLGPAQILPFGQGRAGLTLDLASNFVDNRHQSESLFLDGETWRSNLSLDYSPVSGLELGISLPYLYHQSGFLDGFIEGWHETFGLPQGGRDQAPRGGLAYNYWAASDRQFNLDSATGGWGDLSLGAGWQLWQKPSSGRALALRARLKLPTGAAAKFTGSGSTDFALWLSGEQRITTASRPWFVYGGGGALWSTKGDFLPNHRRQQVFLVSLGLGWQAFETLGLQVQFDGHSAFYHSEQSALGRFAGLLSMGGSLALGKNMRLELAVSEDLLVSTASDVSFHLALRRNF